MTHSPAPRPMVPGDAARAVSDDNGPRRTISDVRTLPEWVGRTPDSPVPDRVRVRVFGRYDGICQCGCGRVIRAGERWDAEDEIAIINGGERRERNLRPFLAEHHPAKTAKDVAIKSKTYRMRKLHLGIRKPSRFPGSRDSKWKKKVNGEVVER